MGRAPQDRVHVLPSETAGDVHAYSWDAVPIPVPLSGDHEGAAAVTSFVPPGAKGPHCIRAGLSRCAVHIVRLSQFDTAAAVPSQPPQIEFSVWSLAGEVASQVVAGQWSPPTWVGASGLLIQLAGVLCEGFELRWRVDGTSAPPAVPRQLRAHMRFVVDRVGGPFELLYGPNVANVVSSLTKV